MVFNRNGPHLRSHHVTCMDVLRVTPWGALRSFCQRLQGLVGGTGVWGAGGDGHWCGVAGGQFLKQKWCAEEGEATELSTLGPTGQPDCRNQRALWPGQDET